MADKQYNATKLHKELEAAGLVICGVTSTGRVDWIDEPTAEMISTAEQVKAAHEAISAQELQHLAYLEKGLDAETLVVALWEKVVEGRPEAADELQLIRESIRSGLSQTP